MPTDKEKDALAAALAALRLPPDDPSREAATQEAERLHAEAEKEKK
ncbi:hypothetical protein [Streptomyces bohaiensis]